MQRFESIGIDRLFRFHHISGDRDAFTSFGSFPGPYTHHHRDGGVQKAIHFHHTKPVGLKDAARLTGAGNITSLVSLGADRRTGDHGFIAFLGKKRSSHVEQSTYRPKPRRELSWWEQAFDNLSSF